MRGRCASVLLAVLLFSPFATSQDWHAEEYRAKANVLAAFPHFVDWPAEAFPSPSSPFLICVFGEFSFGTSLLKQTRGAVIQNRHIEVRWAHKEQELRDCHILFVSRSEVRRYTQIFKSVEGTSMLTVGETNGFLTGGGAVEFSFDNGRLQFAVNIVAAENAHLRVSSNMLALASHVVRAEVRGLASP